MPSDRTIARIVVYAVVSAAAALPLVMLYRTIGGAPDVAEREAGVAARSDAIGEAGVHRDATSRGVEGRAEGRTRFGGRDASREAARDSEEAARGGAYGSDAERARRRELALRETDGTRNRAPSDRSEDFDLERETRDEALRLLSSPDTAERLDGVDELAAEDPDVARREAENVLDSASEDRWDVYDKLIDLAPDDAGRIGVALRALGDSDPEVRDQAAYWLSTEDADRHPQILQGLRGALESEQDESARDSIESALESLDLEFEPEWLTQLDAESVDPDLM
jgi:hypothetical protein